MRTDTCEEIHKGKFAVPLAIVNDTEASLEAETPRNTFNLPCNGFLVGLKAVSCKERFGR